jgi:beta-barrel assembly-enhancing protease
MVFEALYYDGKSSFGNPATVQLLADCIKITTANDSIEWKLSELNLPDSFFNNNNTVVKHGAHYPYSAIEVTGKEFQHYFKQAYPALNIKATDIKVFQNTGNKVIVLVILGVIALMLLSYFFFIPAVAELIAKRIPQSYEIALGDKMFEQLNAGFQVDSEQTALANAFFHELNVAETYPVKITVVHSDISNAFAFPGGNIVVYDEMFKIMNTKEEFAALLSHEYSHVAKRHITRSLFRNLGTYLVISLVISDVNGIMAVLLQNADNLKSLSYSRSLEQEADEEGMLLMQEAGLNTNGMIDLFKHLGDANKESQVIPEFLSTHPMLEARMKNIKRLAKKNKSNLQSTPELDSLWLKLKALN